MKRITLYILLFFFVAFLIGGGSFWVLHSEPEPSMEVFDGLKKQLIQDGFRADFISVLFSDSRFYPHYEVVPGVVENVTLEGNVFYRRSFLFRLRIFWERFMGFFQPQEDVVLVGKKFMAEHRELLNQIENRFHVKPEIIVAVLAVESRFGKQTGAYPVMNVLSSLAVLDQPMAQAYLNYDSSSQKRLIQISRWAYAELVYFLRYCQKNQLDPLSVKGSYAGAIGLCQFMPSSIFHYGIDGDRDGRIDLFSIPDALCSIANYLHRVGFKPDDSHSWARALYAYNHSWAYVDSILELAQQY